MCGNLLYAGALRASLIWEQGADCALRQERGGRKVRREGQEGGREEGGLDWSMLFMFCWFPVTPGNQAVTPTR
jgi:hypothetical protein